jgi:hypothetical protein
MTKILIVDTSIMCVWLKVPGKEVAGKSNEYTYDIVAQHIEEERQKGSHNSLHQLVKSRSLQVMVD